MEHFCLGIITIQKFTKNENSQKMRDKKIKKAYKLIRWTLNSFLLLWELRKLLGHPLNNQMENN